MGGSKELPQASLPATATMADLVVRDVSAESKDSDKINFDSPDTLALLLQTITPTTQSWQDKGRSGKRAVG